MEKKIQFSGVDTGVSSMISKLKSESRDLGAVLIKEAMAYSSSLKDQVSYIQDQIQAIERRNKAEGDQNAARASFAMHSAVSKAEGDPVLTKEERSARISTARKEYKGALTENNEALRLERTQVSLLREILDTAKAQARDEISGDREGVSSRVRSWQATGSSSSEEESLKLSHQQQMLGLGPAGGSGMNMFGGVVLANLLQDLGRTFSSVPSMKNETSLIRPAMELMGTAAGGLAGNGLDWLAGIKIAGFGLGQTNLGPLGASVGKQMASTTGAAMERTFAARLEVEKAENYLTGLSGSTVKMGGSGDFVDRARKEREREKQPFLAFGTPGTKEYYKNLFPESFTYTDTDITNTELYRKSAPPWAYKVVPFEVTESAPGPDMGDGAIGYLEKLGIDEASAVQMMGRVAASSGTVSNVVDSTVGAATVMKAFSMDEGQVMDQFRQGRVTGRFDVEDRLSHLLEQLISNGIMTKEDRVLFSEFVKDTDQVVGMLGQFTTNVDARQAQAIRSSFAMMGGEFKAGDPRAMSLISSVQNSLANPSNDYLQANSYRALKKLNPGANFYELQEMQYGGANTPGYYDEMMKMALEGTSSDAQRRYNVAASVLGDPKKFAPAQTLIDAFNNGTFNESLSAMKNTGGQVDAISMALGNVSPLEKSEAEIKNAFKNGGVSSFDVILEKFTEAMGLSLKEITDNFGEDVKNAVRGNAVNPRLPTIAPPTIAPTAGGGSQQIISIIMPGTNIKVQYAVHIVDGVIKTKPL